MILTASKIPDPEPMAPIKSAKMVRIPTAIPPTQAAIGIYFYNLDVIESFRIPTIAISYSLNYLTRSFVLSPEISIQILEKKAQEARINMVYTNI